MSENSGEVKFNHRCVVCGIVNYSDDPTPVPKGAKYLCQECYVKVQKAYEEKHQGRKKLKVVK